MNSKKLSQGNPQQKHAPPKIIRLRSVSSTNDYARELADSGAKHGTLVTSNVQTHGRGRTGSNWISPLGGLWMSIILRPRSLNEPALIPLIASLAVTKALDGYGVNGGIKWPNDIIVNDRKLAGILCESSVVSGKFQWVIVGVGINVNNTPPRLASSTSNYKSISMIQITGGRTNLSSLANSIRDLVMRHYDKLQTGDERELLDEYDSRHTLRNRKVRISLTDQILEGIANGVDHDGRLSLKSTSGLIYSIGSEDALLIETA